MGAFALYRSTVASLPIHAVDTGWSRVVSMRNVGLLLVGAVVVRFVASALVPLIPEEAYYWCYAQHPSLSYYDHPPMVAWVVRLGTMVFGSTEIGVRWLGNVIALAAVWMLYLFSRLWVNRTASLIAASSLLILPVYFWTGFINTMDSQLVLFWIVSLLGASIALRRTWGNGSWIGWYVAGIGFGGAMLSKYTGVFVGAGIGMALLLHRPWRRFLLSPHVYLGAVLGVAMFTPVLLWNYRNGWASFRFQFLDRSEAHPLMSWQTLWSPLNFSLLQLAAVTPLLFALCVQSFRYRRQRRFSRLLNQPLLVLAVASGLPLLLALAWKSILFNVHFDWTAPLYLALMPLVGQILAAQWRMSLKGRRSVNVSEDSTSYRQGQRWQLATAVTVIACVAGNVGCLFYLMILTPHTGHPDSFGPWLPLARVVEGYENQLESQTGREPLVIGRGKYRLASELAFYRSGVEPQDNNGAFTTSEWFFGDVEGLGFAYWLNRIGWIGRDCIYVSDKNDIASVVSNRFDHVRLVDDPSLRGMPGGITYHLAICQGFRGIIPRQPITK